MLKIIDPNDMDSKMIEGYDFDFIVIGGGSAGYAAARTACENRVNVAIIDGADELGGLCILRGCMPSKTLIYSSEVLHLAKQGGVFGFENTSLTADLALMQKRKKAIIAEFADYRKGQLEDGRFSLFRSRAKFLDENSVMLEDSTILRAHKFLIATHLVLTSLKHQPIQRHLKAT